MRKRGWLVLLAAVMTLGSAAEAQECLGLPSFTGGGVHVQGSGEFPDSATAYAVALSGGTEGGLFSNLGVGRVSFTGLSRSSTVGFLEVGAQRSLGRARVCPVAGGYLGVGPDDPELERKVTSKAAAVGLSLGLPIGPRVFRLVPNAGVRYQYTSQRVDEGEYGSLSDADGSGTLDLGLGFVIRDRISVQPIAHFPLGGAGRRSFGVWVAATTGWNPL